jgi:hypothetical protein
MTHPVSTTYLDQQVAKVSAALPGAGAYDTPLALHCPGFDFVTFYCSYLRGGVGGSVRCRLEVCPDQAAAPAWTQQSLYAAAAVAAGADASSLEQRETILYTSTSANAELFVVGPVALKGTVERLRMACAEVGAVATPGTMSIDARFS